MRRSIGRASHEPRSEGGAAWPQEADRIAGRSIRRVEGNTHHRSALLGGRYVSAILAPRNLGTHPLTLLRRGFGGQTGLSEAGYNDQDSEILVRDDPR